ncbi:MAG TPA: sulfatase-like hydrolase/transferase [Oscillospiraceae bacterium]|nr:sulfatase-like hydrolase/transferase [Oscillospiraceae bacterium]HPF55017.1 sulfatase-like hydrolase/transferase [Clostridiales bacterium]HPK35915.1 sulfatase-like hydrolase/transferase [Oscillospiraceae bacterium]HPR75609.1 sulfatase-like hydrolase/transferase [Oscillospiraceae bacterium]
MKPKNILLFFTDQMRADCIHELGNPVIQTPHLDELARESVVFDRCYTPSPVCVPARYSMMTGLYPAHTGCGENAHHGDYEGDGMYARLTANGYHTCGIGKMHFPFDPYGLHGYSERFSQEEFLEKDDTYGNDLLKKGYTNVFDYNGQRGEMYYIPQVSQLPAKDHPTAWIGDRSIDFIKNYSGDKPFFLMSSFIHPHPPFAPPAPWNKLYRKYQAVVPNVPEDSKNMLTWSNLTQNRYKGLSAGIDKHLVNQTINHYYACISFVDYQIGRIVAALKERGLYDDTLIVFTSDHGDFLGDYNCYGKRSMIDAAARVPLLIRVPGKSSEHRTDPVSLVDIEPTLLDWAGIRHKDGEFDGINIFKDRHDYIYSQYERGEIALYMIASDHDKLVYSVYDRKYYYYDSFPETANTYDPKNPRCAELRELLNAYIEMASKPAADPAEIRAMMDSRMELCRAIPYAAAPQDHKNAHNRELAAIPKEYTIDL